MTIAFDLRVFSTGASERGMGRVARQIISNLCRSRPSETFYGLIFPGRFDPNISADAVRSDSIFSELSNLVPIDMSAQYRLLPLAEPNRFKERETISIEFFSRLKELNVSEFWNLTPLIGDAFVPIAPFPNIAIVYDMIPFLYQDHYLTDPRMRQYYIEHIAYLRHCDHLISISEQSKFDCVALFGMAAERITPIYPKLGPLFLEKQDSFEDPRNIAGPGDPEAYALCVSSHHYTKNLLNLCKAWTAANKKAPLGLRLKIVLASQEFRTALKNTAELDDSIELLVNVSEAELVGLYRKAWICVQPSRYEGFGYPVVEAIALGTPVLANDTPIFKEVGGTLAHYFDANNTGSLEKTLTTVLGDKPCVNKLRDETRAHSREHIARLDGTMQALASIGTIAKENYRTQSESVAYGFASSFYPDKCGIVDYTHNIASRLANASPTFIIVRPELEPSISPYQKYIVCSARALDLLVGRRPKMQIYYQLGGAHWQYFMWALMEKYPGVAVFHDLTMAGGVFHLSNHFDKREIFNTKFFAAESETIRNRVLAAVGKSTDAEVWKKNLQTAVGGRMNAYPLRTARESIVHDKTFKQILLDDAGDASLADRIRIAPLSKKNVKFRYRNLNRSALREAYGLGANGKLVGIFGNIVRNKLVLESITALAALRAKYALRILVVGNPVDPAYAAEVKAAVKELSLSDCVNFLEWVDDDDFERFIYMCDMVCNLRYPSNDGMTGPGVQAIAAGTPVVVSKEAKWSVFSAETGCVVSCAGPNLHQNLVDAFDKTLQNSDALRKAAYAKYTKDLAMKDLVQVYYRGTN